MTVFTQYDSVDPSAIPASERTALYGTGRFSARSYDVRRFALVLWIDDVGDDPAGCSIADVETGAIGVDQVPDWCERRLQSVPGPGTLFRLYCNLSTWPALKAAVRTMTPEMQTRVRWWIANPTGVPHIVPGSDATQFQWAEGYDVSLCRPSWY